VTGKCSPFKPTVLSSSSGKLGGSFFWHQGYHAAGYGVPSAFPGSSSNFNDEARTARSRFEIKAFSLVEVALAIGLLAFAGIAVLGFLPTALNVARSTSIDAVSSTIAANVKADLQQVELHGSGISLRYFDLAGLEVPASSADAVIQAYRSEKTQVLPGLVPNSLKRVSIQVLHNPGKTSVPVDADGWATVPPALTSKTFRFYVVR